MYVQIDKHKRRDFRVDFLVILLNICFIKHFLRQSDGSQ